jgi:hypothetical protein
MGKYLFFLESHRPLDGQVLILFGESSSIKWTITSQFQAITSQFWKAIAHFMGEYLPIWGVGQKTMFEVYRMVKK